MKDPILLNDEQVRKFIADGYIAIHVSAPGALHALPRLNACAHMRTAAGTFRAPYCALALVQCVGHGHSL